MKISVSSVDQNENRSVLATLSGKPSSFHEEHLSYESVFSISDVQFKLGATFSPLNYKGNILLWRESLALLNTLVTVDDTYALLLKVDDQHWLEIIVSNEPAD